jgi:hypothetical protein
MEDLVNKLRLSKWSETSVCYLFVLVSELRPREARTPKKKKRIVDVTRDTNYIGFRVSLIEFSTYQFAS